MLADSSLPLSNPEKSYAGPMESTYSLTPTLTDTQSISPTLTDVSVPTVSDSRRSVVHTPGQLALLPRAVEIQDLVVLSLLFLGKQHRLNRGGLNDAAHRGLMVGGLGGAC
jgi:hypothetical protein